jgi:5-methylthioribose kinase
MLTERQQKALDDLRDYAEGLYESIWDTEGHEHSELWLSGREDGMSKDCSNIGAQIISLINAINNN